MQWRQNFIGKVFKTFDDHLIGFSQGSFDDLIYPGIDRVISDHRCVEGYFPAKIKNLSSISFRIASFTDLLFKYLLFEGDLTI